MLGFPGRKRTNSTKGKPEIRITGNSSATRRKTPRWEALCCTTDGQASSKPVITAFLLALSSKIRPHFPPIPLSPTGSGKRQQRTGVSTSSTSLQYLSAIAAPFHHFSYGPLSPVPPSPSKLEYLVSRAKGYLFSPSSIARTTDYGEQAKTLELGPKAYGTLQVMSIRPLARGEYVAFWDSRPQGFPSSIEAVGRNASQTMCRREVP